MSMSKPDMNTQADNPEDPAKRAAEDAPNAHSRVFKIEQSDVWQEAQKRGAYNGAPVDLADGFIHFSAADQVAKTLAKHFAGQKNLLLIAVDSAKLGSSLRWEASRGGALFPHLYADLPMDAVVEARLIPDPHTLSSFADWGIDS